MMAEFAPIDTSNRPPPIGCLDVDGVGFDAGHARVVPNQTFNRSTSGAESLDSEAPGAVNDGAVRRSEPAEGPVHYVLRARAGLWGFPDADAASSLTGSGHAVKRSR